MKIHEVIFTVIFVAFLVLAACVSDSNEKDAYERAYYDGYSDAQSKYEDKYSEGYHDGYYEGIARAQHSIESSLVDDIYHLSRWIEQNNGIDPKYAISTMENYLDLPGEISEAELFDAIMALKDFYYGLEDIISGIDDYLID